MAWGLLALLVGVGYGWWKPGTDDKWAILRTGFLAGLALALGFAILGLALGTNPLGLSTVDAPALLLAVAVMTVLFTLGTLAGDWIEDRTTHRAHGAA
ncbi:MAG TPA: hypothetical protein VGR28_05870 [Candidatus Thermoplasmatota archaeon]|jgi:uncharacterized membrane protein YqjE|nr:hypothetical protein [Candidatus Thermoplasmatota archaeon]